MRVCMAETDRTLGIIAAPVSPPDPVVKYEDYEASSKLEKEMHSFWWDLFSCKESAQVLLFSNLWGLNMRIGLHHGSFVAGVIGSNQLRFDIWGEDCPIPLSFLSWICWSCTTSIHIKPFVLVLEGIIPNHPKTPNSFVTSDRMYCLATRWNPAEPWCFIADLTWVEVSCLLSQGA